MKALFLHDTYYTRDEQGNVYTLGVYPYSAWQRYLNVFDHLTVVGRISPNTQQNDLNTLQKSDGPQVDFLLLPTIHSPSRIFFKSRSIKKMLLKKLEEVDCVIIRGPSEYGLLIYREALAMNKVVAIELSGCAFDNTWNHHKLLGKIYAPLKYLRVRKMVGAANFVMYVTSKFLQNRYPNAHRTSHASNVEIATSDTSVLSRRLDKIRTGTAPYKIGLIGHAGNKLKGIHIALEALAELKIDYEFHLMGHVDDKLWNPIINALGIDSGKIIFDGVYPAGEPVLNWLDEMDFYIQPSLHEGLPRSLIEAMSRGLPCLASDTGGIPELLEDQCIHHKGDSTELSRQLNRYLNDADWKRKQAQRNFELALNYTREKLVPIRTQFWNDVGAEIRRRSPH